MSCNNLYVFPIKIGITGGIGSGKSVVSRLLSVMGYPVFDSDQEAKWLMLHDESLKEQLIEAFGDETFQQGVLNRSYLASLIFADSQSLQKMNQLVHPAVRRRFEEWASAKDSKIVFFECAILLESEFKYMADQIWTVSAPLELRINRAMHRDGSARSQVEARIQAQLSQEEKEHLADLIILNDEEHPLIPQIEHALVPIVEQINRLHK